MASQKQLDKLGAAYDVLGNLRNNRAMALDERKRRREEIQAEFEKRVRTAKEVAPLPTILWVAQEVLKELDAMHSSIRGKIPDFDDRGRTRYAKLCGHTANDQSIEKQIDAIQKIISEITDKEITALKNGATGIVAALRGPFTSRSLIAALLSIRGVWHELIPYVQDMSQDINEFRLLRGAVDKLYTWGGYGTALALMYALDNLSNAIVEELQRIAAEHGVMYTEGAPKARSLYEEQMADACAWRAQQLAEADRVQSEEDYSIEAKRLLWEHLAPITEASIQDRECTRDCFESSRAERFEHVGKERIALVGWQQVSLQAVAAQSGLGASFAAELRTLEPHMGLVDDCITIPHVLRLDAPGLIRVVYGHMKNHPQTTQEDFLGHCLNETLALLASYFENVTVRVSIASLMSPDKKQGDASKNKLVSMLIHALEGYDERDDAVFSVTPLLSAEELETFAPDADVRLVLTCDHDSTRAAVAAACAMEQEHGIHCHIIDVSADDVRCGQLGIDAECDWIDYVIGSQQDGMASGIVWKYDTMPFNLAHRTLALYLSYRSAYAANSFLRNRSASEDDIPDVLDIGTVPLAIDATVPENERRFFVDLHRGMDALLHGQEATPEDEVIYVAHSLIWRFVSLSEYVPVEIYACDIAGHGNNMAPFLQMSRAMPSVFPTITTSSDGLLQTVRMLNDRVDEAIKHLFQPGYIDSIVDYNRANPHDSCPLVLFVVFGFPERMDDNSLRVLLDLVESGGPCGISVLLVGNASLELGMYDGSQRRYEQIVQQCTDITTCIGDGQHCFVWDKTCELQSLSLPNATELNSFALSYLRIEEERRSESISFDELLKLVGTSGESDSSRGIIVPVGIGRNNKVVTVDLGKGTSQHALVIGGTGSGKSTLFHTFILSAMHAYGPDQLAFFLMDFKGPEFKVYENHPTPHVRHIAIDAAQVFGEGILEMLVEEMERRNMCFKDMGVSNIAGYVARSGVSMPRIIVIMDEFQVLYGDGGDDKVARNCAALTDTLVKKGRSTGIHLIMATQSLVNAGSMYLEQSTLEQMTVRIGLKCGENDIRKLFGDDLVASVQRSMDGPIGTAVLSDGLSSDVEGFRVAYCSDEERPDLLEGIRSRYADVPVRLRVFEGGRTQPLSSVFASRKGGQVEIIIGEQLKRGVSLCRVLDRRRHNMMVCGDDKGMTRSFVFGIALSALRYHTTMVYMVDGRYLVDEADDELVDGIRAYAGNRFAYAERFDDLFAFVRDVDDAGKRAGRGDRTLLILKDIQFLDDAIDMLSGNPVDEDFDDVSAYEETETTPVTQNSQNPFAESFDLLFGDGAPSTSNDRRRPEGGANPTDILQRLLARGYQRGVQVIVTCDSPQALNRHRMSQAFDNCGERLIFGMSGSDAYGFIDTLNVPTLEEGVGYYSDGRGDPVQVRPYRMPAVEELGDLYESVREEDR